MIMKRPIFGRMSVMLSAAGALAVLITSAAFPTGARAFGATITVTTTADTAALDGQCSLPEAIVNANNNLAIYTDCAAGLGGSGDVIVFSSALGHATIRLASILPAITDTTGLTIDGGNMITLSGDTNGDGSGDVRLIQVYSGVPLTLENLIVEKGYSNTTFGGAIASQGLLTLQGVTVRNNTSTSQGGAIDQVGGSLSISSSTFVGNTAVTGGAAIRYSSGAIMIQDSTFQNNTTTDAGSTYGAALAGDGTLSLTVLRSTFDTNVAKYGGAIFFSSGTLTLVNSTFYANGNSTGGAAGAIYASDGTLTLSNDTIADNLTIGIMLGSTTLLNMRNTILADNARYDCENFNGAQLGAVTNNLITTLPLSPNNCGLSAASIPVLGLAALADNGGSTRTRALLPGSPAIDAGDNASCPATDQRGAVRPLDGNDDLTANCDIGAFEVRPATTTTITSDAPDYSVSGSPVTVSVSVTSDSGAPGGTVNVSLPSSSCIATLSAGAGSCVLYPTGLGPQTILAVYPGDPSHDPSSDTETHTVATTLIFRSVGAQDGWLLESGEKTSQGGSVNSTATTLLLGDDAMRRQYRAILSFSTGRALPDTAVIEAVTLRVRKQAISGGGDPLTLFQGFMVDIRKGSFSLPTLQTTDFRARANSSYGPLMPGLVGGWYDLDLTPGIAYINKLAAGSGLTQIRLRFMLDDNNNRVANKLILSSGNAPAANRPQLVVTYYVP